MAYNTDEIDSNEESINNLYNPNHPDGQAYLNSAKAKLDNHLKLIEQDPYHKVHAHPSNLANTISHYYGIVERQKNFKSNKGNLTPEHLLNIHKLALNHADHHINRIRAQGMRTEGTVSKVKNIRNTFNNIVKEARVQEGSWKDRLRTFVPPSEGGDPDRVHHFQDFNDRSIGLGIHPITRALASPMNVLGHPAKGLHLLAQHYEGNIKRAKGYLDGNSFYADQFKNPAHAKNSLKKWEGHLNAFHNHVMQGILADQARGKPIPRTFEGLTHEHVAEHARQHGLDTSKPFNPDEFKNKIQDFALYRHNHGDTSSGHPLHQGWIAPPEKPKKKAIVTPPPPPPPPPPQVESNIMNKSQRIRDIFESRMNESRKKLQGHLTGTERGHLRNLEAGKGNAELGRELRKDAKSLSRNYPRLSTEVPYRNDPPKSDQFHLTRGEAHDKEGNVVKREPVGARSSLLNNLILRSTSPKVKDRARVLRNRDLEQQNDSTNYARAGLKALFESVLDEVSQRAANKAYWEGEGKPFKGAGRLLANLTNKFKAQQKQPDSEKPPAEKPKAP